MKLVVKNFNFSISRKNIFIQFHRDFEEDDEDYEDEDFMLETGEIRPNTWPRRNRQSRMKKSIGIARGVICLLILVGFGTHFRSKKDFLGVKGTF